MIENLSPSIFFDLDGTLFNSYERLYQLFSYLVAENVLDFNSYWDLKKNQKGHSYILKNYFSYTEKDIISFEIKWLKEIEKERWLSLDKPFDWVYNYLEILSAKYDLYIVTDRQSRMSAINQVSKYEWKKFIKNIFVTEKKVEKHELIKDIPMNKEKSWFIGDTGRDIQTGKIIGIKTAGVLSGFRNMELLSNYNPDIIIKEAVDLTSTLLRL